MAQIVSTGSTISSPEFYKKKLQARRRRRVIFFAIFFVLVIAGVLILHLERLQIRTVTVSGAIVIGQDVVREVVKKELDQSYFWLLPKSSVLLYPNTELKEKLLSTFPRFEFVELTLNGSQELEVYVVERRPQALYCATESCFFLDEKGFIFDRAPIFSSGVYFIFKKEVPLEDPLGQALLGEVEFRALSQFIEDLRSLGFKPEKLSLSLDETEIIMNGGAKVLLPLPAQYGLLLANLEAFLNNEVAMEAEDFQTQILELDLRTPNKIFYKYR
jgi:hypothetical protein